MSQILVPQDNQQEMNMEILRLGEGSLAAAYTVGEVDDQLGAIFSTEGLGVSYVAANIAAAKELQRTAHETLANKQNKFESSSQEELVPISAEALEVLLSSLAGTGGLFAVPQHTQSEPARSGISAAGPSEKHQCQECGEEFDKKSDCDRHFKSIHTGVTHPCSYCDRSYSRSDALLRHMQAKHFEELSPEQQAAVKAREAAKLGKRVREEGQNEEEPQVEQSEEEGRPAKKARVTKSGGSKRKITRAKGSPKKTEVGGDKA